MWRPNEHGVCQRFGRPRERTLRDFPGPLRKGPCRREPSGAQYIARTRNHGVSGSLAHRAGRSCTPLALGLGGRRSAYAPMLPPRSRRPHSAIRRSRRPRSRRVHVDRAPTWPCSSARRLLERARSSAARRRAGLHPTTPRRIVQNPHRRGLASRVRGISQETPRASDPPRVRRLGLARGWWLRTLVILVAVVLAAVAGLATAQPRSGRSRRSHARLTQGLDCGACHSPAGWQLLEGAGGPEGFDHARTGFPLTGTHDDVPCTGCHATGLDTSRACASCHVDEHRGRLGRDCDRCHRATDWRDTEPFAIHRRTRLPLTGMHALADCTECHQRTSERTFSSAPSDCFSCHADDYLAPDVHPVHRGSATTAPFPRNCALCHRPGGWQPAVVDPSVIGASPAALSPGPEHDARFPISYGPHRDAPCASCHVTQSVPRAVECTGCHAHSAVRLQTQHPRGVNTSGGACLACHAGGSTR